MLTDHDIDRLLALGLLKYSVGPISHDDLRAHAAGYGLLEPELFGRSYDLDAEDLAEGGAAFALEELRAVLEANGVVLGTVDLTYDAAHDQTQLIVNGHAHVVGADVTDSNDSWRAYSVWFFAFVNELLAQSGSTERLLGFRLFENDQTGVFVTPELHAALLGLGIGSSLEIPANVI